MEAQVMNLHQHQVSSAKDVMADGQTPAFPHTSIHCRELQDELHHGSLLLWGFWLLRLSSFWFSPLSSLRMTIMGLSGP